MLSFGGQSTSTGTKQDKKSDKKKHHSEKRELTTHGIIRDKTHLLVVNGGGHEAFHGDFLRWSSFLSLESFQISMANSGRAKIRMISFKVVALRSSSAEKPLM